MEEIKKLYDVARKAQEEYSTFTQEQVDKIFFQVAKIANFKRIDLAQQAVDETQRGILEDKVLKNHFASEFIYNKYKDFKSVGVIKDDAAAGYKEIAEPVGVVTAIVPITNPTSTTIFKVLLAIKTRNAIVISPHPQAKSCTYNTTKLLADTAVKFGAPKGLIQCIEEPSMDGTTTAMQEGDIILATGGGGLVRAAYSSGTPAIGVGAGNAPAIIHASADLDQAVSSIVQSNTFDNGMVCATENSVIVVDEVYDEVAKLFTLRNCYIVKEKSKIKKVEKGMFKEGKFGLLNPFPIGKTAVEVAKHFGFEIPSSTKVMLVEAKGTSYKDPLAHEKLSTYLSLYRASDYNDAIKKAKAILKMGPGHTASLHIDERLKEEIDLFQTLGAGRLLINTPSALGGIGDFYNFALDPSLTLACGS
jgi:acetaldehyde dehydrogenase/alcohol dehydrogenase